MQRYLSQCTITEFVLVDIGEVSSSLIYAANFYRAGLLQLVGMFQYLVLAEGLPWELNRVPLWN